MKTASAFGTVRSKFRVWMSVLAVAVCAPLSGQAPRASIPPDQLLLKDYRPRSIFRMPQSRIERPRFPVIDMHSHAYAETEAEVATWVRTTEALGI